MEIFYLAPINFDLTRIKSYARWSLWGKRASVHVYVSKNFHDREKRIVWVFSKAFQLKAKV